MYVLKDAESATIGTSQWPITATADGFASADSCWLIDDPTGYTVAEEDDPVAVPEAVTMRQARLALLGAGLLDTVDTVIAAIVDETTRRAAGIAWDYSSEVQRHNGLVADLAPALGLTDEQVDALFITAATL
jgi:hypothetical protein